MPRKGAAFSCTSDVMGGCLGQHHNGHWWSRGAAKNHGCFDTLSEPHGHAELVQKSCFAVCVAGPQLAVQHNPCYLTRPFSQLSIHPSVQKAIPPAQLALCLSAGPLTVRPVRILSHHCRLDCEGAHVLYACHLPR